jgi:pyruvate/2-oxoglutarate dehydrogenase complex dihydrolipoamide dehydrogenase (E3) component
MVIELTDHILGEFDWELREAVAAHAQTIGVDLHTGTAVRSIASGQGGGFVVEAAGTDGALLRVEADLVMSGAAHAPNMSGIGLEVAGVAFDAHGIHTDAALRTNIEHIWVAGDVRSGSPQLAPVRPTAASWPRKMCSVAATGRSTTGWFPTS